MKKLILVFGICFLTALLTFAQQGLNFHVNYNQDAHYPKSDTALMMYFLKNIQYSNDAVKNNVTGTATFSFIVLPDSSATEIVPLSNIGYGLEEQVAGLIQKLHFAPAVINGSPYRSTMIMNVRINAADNKSGLIEKLKNY
ncbi:MAG TPA: energy transducer TonB [Bacteroidales bacterium]|nr:energy transducer TonB [Bacteroidales bacterium]